MGHLESPIDKSSPKTQKGVESAMSALTSNTLRMLLVAGTILIGSFLSELSIFDSAHAGEASSPSLLTSKSKGKSEEGRKIYNGKGFCYQCHGYDGYIERRPKMDEEMRRVIDQLDPKPADFRNPATLKSKNDQERFETIQNGHRSTAMFPHQFLRDAEINDILAYLSVLRSEGESQAQGSGKNRK
jgi:mono/diheme cytochrome c family protein